MKRNKLTKGLISIGIIVLLLTNYENDYKYNPQYEIVDEAGSEFARYRNGKVFIGTRAYLYSVREEIEENDIIVLDQRYNISDPNMKIISSYKINDKEIRNEILEIICKYEEKYPSRWDRTIESMRLEWFMHNISYIFKNEIDRTKDVDLDNNEERYYDNKILNRILKL